MQLGPIRIVAETGDRFAVLMKRNGVERDVTVPALVGAFALLCLVLCCCGWVF